MIEIYLEGNKGGDIFQLEDLGDGTVHLKVGHCSVYTINHIVPVEFLTAILAKAVLGAGGVVHAMSNRVAIPDQETLDGMERAKRIKEAAIRKLHNLN